ncbi:MAG: hypothetical protein NTW86_27615 [Candidatus Sumerlaeota bacterium]|nr:hypothetical protein [Candidatus Sumerlaeota bacterium]
MSAFWFSSRRRRAACLPPSLKIASDTRSIQVVPLADSKPEAFGALRSQSYGVFFGVDAFTADEGIAPLKCAATPTPAASPSPSPTPTPASNLEPTPTAARF